ncbi:hypothetical protein FHW96_000301 [Novosphingobium sp. SG751A]|uniref:hypothetical protein n=1 Tax=Novosphingobium sp. SG751A TaxID=2587000 RepID=UPI0015533934|nr:hypothetical protein [Novosphingobium sp. SG751A]NOW44174.1 hypothetical protein [Novosphingobium sp. SG751A]
MADLSPLPSPALATATLAAPHARGWWDTILALMVMALANFWEALPHLIQLGGLVVVCLTAVQKLIELGWISNPLRRKKEQSDDLG